MDLLRNLVPAVAIITAEITDVGITTLTKAAITDGLNNFVFTFYYNALASLLLLPYVIYRRKSSPVTFSVLFSFFLLGLFGSVAQLLSFAALKYTSPTLLSALGNLIPVFTFMLSLLFRMEKIEIRSSKGVAICLGALISISGGFVITLYKGHPILNISSSSPSSSLHYFQQSSSWVFGGILMAIACLFIAFWYIIAAATVKEFPEKTTIVFYYVFFSSIFCGIFAFIVERNPKSWELHSHIQTIAVIYAVLAAMFRIGVHTWSLDVTGPIFVTIFKPLGITVAVFMGVLFLGETLYVGSIVGSIIITVGFYGVMWGKWKEESVAHNCLESNSQKKPLLHNHEVHEEI